MVAVRHMGDMPYYPVFVVVTEQHQRFPVYWRDGAFRVFIEHPASGKGLFPNDADERQFAFGWRGGN